MSNKEVRRELNRLIRGAVRPIGGSGGRFVCKYCLRQSYEGQQEHYRKGVNNESDEHCAVTVMRAARDLLGAAARPDAKESQ